MHKDGTAQGVAKVRHQESLLPPKQQLYHDPYAYAMFPGSTVQKWIGPNMIDKIYGWMGLAGFTDMISIRTKWLDDQIIAAVVQNNEEKEAGERARQLIILGAGYDTRGFRLNLWENNNDVTVVEVDQPEVQKKKLANLEWLIQKDSENGEKIANRMKSKQVQFLPVNFNTDDLQQKLQSMERYNSNHCSIITMEGVTQYIPKESTADTLKKLKDIIGPGSTVLITYVDQKCFAEPDTLPKSFRWVQSMSAKVGEPWISGWSKEEFEEFVNECGYQVVSDTAPEDYNETVLKSVGRNKFDENELLSMERFVVAKIL